MSGAGVIRQPMRTEGAGGFFDPTRATVRSVRTQQQHAHTLGVLTRRREMDRVMNPFITPGEADMQRRWNDGWMQEQIRLHRLEKRGCAEAAA